MNNIRLISRQSLFTLLFLLCLSVVSSVQAQLPELSHREGKLSVEAATLAGGFHSPLDSTPDPLGNTLYFVAVGKHGAGVFRVAAVADSPAVEIAGGTPFVAPTGIVTSTDGTMLFIADAQAWNASSSGQIFALPTSGGAPIPLPSAAGTKPQNLTVVMENGVDVIYYTGRTIRSRQPAVFRLPVDSKIPARVVAQGKPFVEPDGVAVTSNGEIYVADRASAGNGRGHVFHIRGQNIRAITSPTVMGNPAGIALMLDESELLVSSYQRNGYDQVLIVDLKTLQTEVFKDVVGENIYAGGVHRAHERDVYSWAGNSFVGDGTVYVIRPRP